MRIERGDPSNLDFEALVAALRAAGFDVELAGPEEATERILREHAGGVWQVVQVILNHLEADGEAVIIGVLSAWAASKISRKDDPEPDEEEVPPQANLWLPDGTVKEIPLLVKDGDPGDR